MNNCRAFCVLILCWSGSAFAAEQSATVLAPLEKGPYSVGATNMEVAAEYADIGDDAMHGYLLGLADGSGHSRYIADILKYPDAAWNTNVQVPDEPTLYGPASNKTLPITIYLTYPSAASQTPNRYTFPYFDGKYGVFEDMLAADETPSFADNKERYPLIIIAHGSSAHGIYDVAHAHQLASHGYIVAVISYGDDRTVDPSSDNEHLSFLRPLLTKAVLDSILASEQFGDNIDSDNIGITGHSFGGFTSLAVAGGPVFGNQASVTDKRIKAAVITAPWVGGKYKDEEIYVFGLNNSLLSQVTVPMLCLFGSKDTVTLASFILPAMKKLSGPTYVVEMVDQPHIFEDASWYDRNNWELLFFSAYLKHDAESLAKLKSGRSMQGGNKDFQLFNYQNTKVKATK